MKRHIASAILIAALGLGGTVVVEAQSGWPGQKTTKASTSKVQRPRKPATTPRSRKPVVRRKSSSAGQEAVLASMVDLVSRQAAAIEALARRLEAAERRLDLVATQASTAPRPIDTPTVADAYDESTDPFRAARSVDWSQVIAELFE